MKVSVRKVPKTNSWRIKTPTGSSLDDYDDRAEATKAASYYTRAVKRLSPRQRMMLDDLVTEGLLKKTRKDTVTKERISAVAIDLGSDTWFVRDRWHDEEVDTLGQAIKKAWEWTFSL